MTTLEKIRNKAGLLVTVIGVALLAFIVGDMLNGSQSFMRQSQDKVIVINGERVTTEQFNKAIADMTEIYRMQSGQASLSAEYTQQINAQVYDALVREMLIQEEAAKIGMQVSSEELADIVSGDHISPMLMQMPFFKNPQTGVFDKAMLTNFLQAVVGDGPATPEIQQARQFWMFWEKNIKNQRLEEKFNTLLSKTITPNSLDVKAQYEGGKVSADFAYAMQALSTVADSTVQITDAEIKSRYEELKDVRYKQGETRAVKYFYVDIAPNESDYEEAETTINDAREEFATTTEIASFVNMNSDASYNDVFTAVTKFTPEEQQFIEKSEPNQVFGPYLENDAYRMYRVLEKTVAPDSIKARHIVLAGQDKKATKALADSLVTVLKKGGDFAALAAEFSADTRSAENGGELGWFTEMDALAGIGPEFKDASFAADLKEYIVIETNFGVIVAQVTDETKPVAKAKVAQYAINVSASSRTFQQLYANVNSFIATNNTLEAIEKNALENGFNILSNGNVQTTDYTLGVIKDARPAIQWAFHNPVGTVSDVKEIDNKFVVLVVTGETPAGYTPLAQVSEMIRFELLRKKKAEKIVNDLKAKSITTMDGYAQAMGSRVDTAKFVSFNTARITGIGNEPVLSGSAPYVAENTLTGPLAGNNAVYVLSVTDKTTSEAPFDAAAEKASMSANWAYRLMYQVMSVLENDAEIEDYRVNFY